MKKLLSLLLIMITCSVGIAHATGESDTETVTSLKYVTDELNTRQDKFGANDGKAMTFTNTAGGNLPRDVKESLGTSTSDNGLPTVSAVNAGLDDKQNTIPAMNTNTVVTYTGVAGTVGQKGIYQDTGTYASQQNNLIDAGTFNAALRNGLNDEFVCADRDPVSNQCWLWSIDNETENRSPNLFDISKVPGDSRITNNGDGSITVTTGPTSSAVSSDKTLSQLAPGLEVGKTYTLSFKTTGTDRYIYLRKDASSSTTWRLGSPTITMTQDLLDSTVYFYASGVSTTATISEIQIEEGTTATPYVPYGNIYIPQNQTAQNQ